jgi:hypothetical protein
MEGWCKDKKNKIIMINERRTCLQDYEMLRMPDGTP